MKRLLTIVADGLHDSPNASHRQVIHLDLKGDNLLFTRNGDHVDLMGECMAHHRCVMARCGACAAFHPTHD
jgi:serine/threonine protein kinase